MDLVVSPIAVALNTQGGGNAPTFTPGQIVDALVMRVLDQTHVQLAVGDSLIDVQTAVPLPQGAHVHLAVRATPDGLRLVVLHPDEIGGAAGGAVTAGAAAASKTADAARSAESGAVMRQPLDPAALAANPQAALAQAVRAAALQQDGLAPLFANLAAMMTRGALPDALRLAVAQLMAFRLPTDAPVEPEDVAGALARSGLFLEAGLAAGAAATRTSPSGDMKAALVALRAALAAMAGGPAAGRPEGTESKLQGFVEASLAGAGHVGAGRPETAGAQALYRALAQAITAGGLPAGATAAATAPPAAAATPAAGSTAPGAAPGETGHPSRPPPPYGGAAPAAQPVAAPTLAEDVAPNDAARTLLAQTDAALARHTLLQAASLPGSAAPGGAADAAGARWVFEIPFATPQGTTVAQFEISRDGKGQGTAGKAAPAWRARFAVEIEPVGLVHAQVTVTGERAGVTLWAERGDSAALLRDNAGVLAERLRAAELDPSEVVVRDGAPPRPAREAAPAAGRFLDRAS
ncbi:flagellar hook-length control protein FliK [Rhodoplanes sp. SY1]|uniref:flagellar hook-length control protein FliK n=1 Tax=Rhodoplanes sp. SY1 TaxID=3166646 RepID=UPI0038B4CC1C